MVDKGVKNAIINDRIYKFNGFFDVRTTFNDMMKYIENTLIYDITVKEKTEETDDGEKLIKSIFEADKKFDEHTRIIIKMTIELEGRDVEKEVDGKKIIVQKSSATMFINGYYFTDINEEIKKANPFKKFLMKFYYKYVVNDEAALPLVQGLQDIKAIVERFKIHTNSNIK